MRLILLFIALLFAVVPGVAYSQAADQPKFSIINSAGKLPPPPGYYERARRNFIDMWNELHPPGTEEKIVIPQVKTPPKPNVGGIGQVGGVATEPERTVDTSPGGSMAPDVPNELPGGGIGAVGAPQQEPTETEEIQAAPIPKKPTAEPTEEQPPSAIGNVGGLGTVGTPDKK